MCVKMKIVILSLRAPEDCLLYQSIKPEHEDTICFKGYKKTDVDDLSVFSDTARLMLAPAAIGCGFSHLKILEMLANSETLQDNEPILILEDDAYFDCSFAEAMSKLDTYLLECTQIPLEWDIFYPGFFPPGCFYNSEAITKHVCRALGFMHGTHAYCVTKRSAAKIYATLKAEKLRHHIDVMISDLIAKKRIIALHVHADHRFIHQTSVNAEVKLSRGLATAESSQIRNCHPIILTSFLSKIKLDHNSTAAYVALSSTYQIAGRYNINLLVIIECFLALAAGVFKIRLATMVLMFCLVFLPDFLYSAPSVEQLMFEFFLIVGFWFIGINFF